VANWIIAHLFNNPGVVDGVENVIAFNSMFEGDDHIAT
jgi:hypothetical protein